MSVCYTVTCTGCSGQFSVFHGAPASGRCYLCHNGVTADELVGSWNAATEFSPAEVDAMRIKLAEAGKDPGLAGVILRQRARTAVAA